MTHPNSLDLEAFACEDSAHDRRASATRARVASHVEECSACSAFVAGLRDLLASGPSQADADHAVARALARVGNVDEAERRAPARSESRRGGRRWLATSSVVAPLAAAAAIVLLTRSHPLPEVPQVGPPVRDTAPARTGDPAKEGDRVLMAPLPQVAQDPDTRFKGGVQVAVVRERGGVQERFSSVVQVKPGDRLRVEVALDREQAILGAVLADDGSYLELMPEGVRGAGTHFSERSAKVDGSPTRGTILIGSPEAVAQARATRQWDGVRTLRVEVEQGP